VVLQSLCNSPSPGVGRAAPGSPKTQGSDLKIHQRLSTSRHDISWRRHKCCCPQTASESGFLGRERKFRPLKRSRNATDTVASTSRYDQVLRTDRLGTNRHSSTVADAATKTGVAVDIGPLLDIRSAANRLGCSERFVRRLVQERRIPFVKLAGTRVRFLDADLDKWISGQRFTAMR
jgi:excisionase family DNA binding protein